MAEKHTVDSSDDKTGMWSTGNQQQYKLQKN